jgi:hypothetical protein
MILLRSIFNIGLGAVGGVLGNLVAAWIQQDAWGNTFTPARIAGTVAGFVLVILALAFLDAAAHRREGGSPIAYTSDDIHNVLQIGPAVVRVFRGSNIIQIGGGTIEQKRSFDAPRQAEAPSREGPAAGQKQHKRK